MGGIFLTLNKADIIQNAFFIFESDSKSFLYFLFVQQNCAVGNPTGWQRAISF